VEAIELFLSDVDEFKILLGMTLDTPLIVSGTGLDDLRKKPVRAPTLKPKKALMEALDRRLDFTPNIDCFEDAKRKIGIAENELKTDVDIFANASLANTGDRKWESFNLRNWSGGVGFRFKLPLDRLLERNDFRREIVDFERQLRSLEGAVDDISTAMRTGLRQVAQYAESYRIQKLSVDLAKRRAESSELLIKAGRASTRDLLEAKDDLISAQNAQTRNLVDYHLSRLRLLRDIGLLDVRNGALIELDDVKLNKAGQIDVDKDVLPTPTEVFGASDKETTK
jgi:outer membrane protein TolC